ncbi:MAG: DUF998 domain-containing protein [bacterium]
MERVAAALYALDIVLLLTFQVLNREYGLFRHAVSDYGLGKTAGLFRAYMLAGSLAAPVLAWQFWHAGGTGYPVMIPVYLLLVMAGRMALGLYPNDLRGAPRTRSGQVHHAATLIAFTCAYMAVAEATPLLASSKNGLLPGVLIGLKHLISLGFIAAVLTISPPLRRFFGLAERLFLYATAFWFLAATLTLPPI